MRIYQPEVTARAAIAVTTAESKSTLINRTPQCFTSWPAVDSVARPSPNHISTTRHLFDHKGTMTTLEVAVKLGRGKLWV